MPLAALEVDGVRYRVDYCGHDQPLAAWLDLGPPRTFAPWRLRQHLAALDGACEVRDGELDLDAGAYAASMLGGLEDVPTWGRLALWWAAGGPLREPPPGYALRPWSLLERAAALRAATDRAAGTFHVGRFLSLLLSTCVTRTGGPDPLDLPLVHGGPLLAAACRLCAPQPLIPPELDDPALRRLTTRVCAALGWSPARVWQTPAGEIDQVLALLGRAPEPPPPRSLSRLAGLPDTHTIRIEDD